MTQMSKDLPEIIVIAHNIRSTHNVGAIFRTAEGFGITKILLSGYTPYPTTIHDPRLPHISDKLTSQIHKTALGAETMVPFEYSEEIPLKLLKEAGFQIVALEQDSRSIPLSQYKTPKKIALVLGEEVHGITQELLEQCDDILEIPMVGKKESFNVSVAAGIALYALVTVAI
jgi:23S rRNA (guanosine2251-2'-O)-methyltransferase